MLNSFPPFFDDLPDEIGVNILRYLDFSSLINFDRVSKRTHALSSDNAFWREKIRVDFPYLEQNESEAFTKDAKNLYLQHCRTYFDKISALEDISGFVPNTLRKLKSHEFLSVIRADDQSLESLIARMTKGASYRFTRFTEGTIYALRLAHGDEIYIGPKWSPEDPSWQNVRWAPLHTEKDAEIYHNYAMGIMGFNGYLKTIQKHLDYSKDEKGHRNDVLKILKGAVVGGRLPVVELLLDKVSLNMRTQLCKAAVQFKHSHIVQYIVENSSVTNPAASFFPCIIDSHSLEESKPTSKGTKDLWPARRTTKKRLKWR